MESMKARVETVEMPLLEKAGKVNVDEVCECEEGHCHHHGHGNFAWPAVSLLMLVAGIICDSVGAAWFELQAFKTMWFVLAYLPVGLPVLSEAWHAIKSKDFFNEFTLMLIASIGAFAIGEYPEAVAVMLFYTIGEMLQHKAVERATSNISKLLDVRPAVASVLRGNTYVEVHPQSVALHEQIEVKPGGRVPLDGVLIDDEALFDTSALTGESVPRCVKKGEEVLAGMISLGQVSHVEVTKPYSQSELARILEIVKNASARKAPAERFISRFAKVYTPVVMALALLIVLVPAIVAFVSQGTFEYVFSEWLYRGLVFLVISCPCALVISVPLGYFAGMGAASRLGVLFKGGNYLYAVTKIDCVAFDKTGTLTSGKFEVNDVLLEQGIKKEKLLRLLASAESKSTHPMAKAVVEYAVKCGISTVEGDAVHEIAGHGVEAVVDGVNVVAGNISLLESRGIKTPKMPTNDGATVIACAFDGKYVGAVLLSDKLKETSVETIAQLKELGISDINLLSGDKKDVVDAYARQLHIDGAHGELLPEDKVNCVENKIKEGRCVAFVGDGMNDAPVLALSNVGIAMGGLGSDAAIESADVVIQTDNPVRVATAIKVGRYTHGIVKQNIIGAISAKAVVLVAGALGFASLWMAVFADVGVALLAVMNSMRILGKNFK